jgi:hypothetical protein
MFQYSDLKRGSARQRMVEALLSGTAVIPRYDLAFKPEFATETSLKVDTLY